MRIGELASATGFSVHTLRYYEKRGLLKPSIRTESNYRVYSAEDADTLAFIQRCKDCGFSLEEIEALVSIHQRKADFQCEDAKRLTRDKAADVRAQIVKLNEILVSLETLEALCNGGDESAEHCNIIQSLEGKD
ncbi:MAG: MerR family transcriptional regulator [Pontibacterium sp.]